MKKIKYVFLFTGLIVLWISCSKQAAQITGPVGATGSAGAPGGALVGVVNTSSLQLNSSTVIYGTAPKMFAYYPYPNYKTADTYMLSVYAEKVNGGEWYKLPWYNVYQTGDELYSAIGHDSVKIFYYNSSANWPNDSAINTTIIIVPQQP